MASYEKVQGDGLVTSCDNSPHEVGQDIPVLVLATAVITVQVDLLLPQPIVLKVVVEIGNDGIGPLAATVALINEVVNLPGDALHAHSKDAHLPEDQKVQGARLHGERRKVHLLGIVKTEVHCKVCRTRGLGSQLQCKQPWHPLPCSGRRCAPCIPGLNEPAASLIWPALLRLVGCLRRICLYCYVGTPNTGRS